jgi:putative transposase
VQRTIRLKLQPTAEQRQSLLGTLEQHTACYNAVTRYGWDNDQKNGVELHKATYYDLRSRHPELPAQLVIAARMRATESLGLAFALRKKKNHKGEPKKVSCPHATLSPIRYDARSYRFEPSKRQVGLSTIHGRLAIPVKLYHHAEQALSQALGFDSADLLYRKGEFFLHLVVTLPTPPFVEQAVIGVDFGETRPAVTSDNGFFGKRCWKGQERRYFRLKRKLQRKGTPSAKRHLKRLAQKVTWFRAECDHVVSRQLVDRVPPGTTIVVENLTEIRTSGKRRGKQQRRQFHQWSFARLRALLTYKAEAKGCLVVGVDPRNTSKTCARCGYVHRSNRRSQAEFRCRRCGYQLNADLNGARNIAQKYLAGDGRPVASGLSVNQPRVSAAVSPPDTSPSP